MLDLATWAGNNTGRQQYERFVRRLLDGGLAGLVREYAGLGRLTVELIAQWVSTTTEFLTRLTSDRAQFVGELLPATA